ncbi:MAG: F0F1 ATP synthase subunit delta [Alphaproteobacteria bacterium]|nr:F0F1 ATP synthase subunit delta [Alphaproteobacteria bacterium]
MTAQIENNDISRRYAHACFSLAREGNQIEPLAADLKSLQVMLEESADLRKFLDNPTLRRTDQEKALAALAEKAGFCPLTKKILGTLAHKRRLPMLAGIIAALQGEIAESKGEITAEVTAAEELSQEQAGHIAAALKKSFGRTVTVVLKKDAAIIGGLIIRVGSKLIDSSVRAKLDRLHRALKNPNASQDKKKKREVA